MIFMKDKGAHMIDEKSGIVSRDPEVVGGELVSAGPRVPAQNLVDYLKAGHTLDYFLDGFPSVSREQATACLDMTLEAANLARSAR
jgi:uncharacterized protein (DUF433 family)